VLGKFRLKMLPDLWIFILIFDLSSAFFYAPVDNVACRLIATTVEVLEPCVERDHKQTAGLSLESLPGASLLPYRGRAAAVQNVNKLFVDVALGR
jgi:hypothetical protein